MEELIATMEAKGERDQIRSVIIAELRRTPNLPADLLMLLTADEHATSRLRLLMNPTTKETTPCEPQCSAHT